MVGTQNCAFFRFLASFFSQPSTIMQSVLHLTIHTQTHTHTHTHTHTQTQTQTQTNTHTHRHTLVVELHVWLAGVALYSQRNLSHLVSLAAALLLWVGCWPQEEPVVRWSCMMSSLRRTSGNCWLMTWGWTGWSSIHVAQVRTSCCWLLQDRTTLWSCGMSPSINVSCMIMW